METKRLKRIKPQPIPRRRWLWQRKRNLPPRPQNAEEELNALLAQFAQAARFRYPIISKWIASALSLILSAFLISLIASVLPMPAPWLLFVWLTILLPVMLLAMCFTASDRLLGVSQQLSGSDDVRAIPALMRVLSWPEARARVAAAHALTRLLPCLQPIDADLLDNAARSLLHRHLVRPKTQRGQDLAIAFLKALESVGDDRDLRPVTALAHRRACNAVEQRLQDAALACLPYLAARIEQPLEGLARLHVAASVADPPMPVRSALEQGNDTQETTLPVGTAKNS